MPQVENINNNINENYISKNIIDYSKIKGSETTIVIDNGSYQCRAAWATQPQPDLIFRSIIAKVRAKKANEKNFYVGSDFPQIDSSRLTIRSPFDNNICCHPEIQELIFDHIFSNLGIDTPAINHPILLTEPVCNLSVTRKMITELLFETYAVPKLNFGIDGIFAYNHLMKINNLNEMEDGIIINSGNNTTHLLVIHNHQFQANKTLRLSIGGHHITEYLRELIQIKYPNLKNLITTPRLQEIKQKFLYVGDNYLDQLKQFHYLSPFVDKKQLIIQFPIPASQQSKENNQNSNELNELEKERKLQLRKQQGQRLSEMAQQRRQKQLEDQQSKLEELEDLRLQKKNYSAAQFKKLLEEYNHKNIGALDREIEALYANINWNKTIITQNLTF
eukprot:TRINITY_DN2035_c0_g1_i1.p1 TRINITY_DN2035_c0_g1~~TRINITY_DN2035_c0_g1_i1.p1  ORF type:complete len:390 (+),score=136.47 TRINITY_DN2035_c0_g1_i1:188-1357(+)